MKAGIATVGMRVCTMVAFAEFPQFPIGSRGTVRYIITQVPGANDDAVGVQFDSDPTCESVKCLASDLLEVL